jgi:hypothetical protein
MRRVGIDRDTAGIISTSDHQYIHENVIRARLAECAYLKCETCSVMLWWLRRIRDAAATRNYLAWALGARASLLSDPGSAIVLNTPHTFSRPLKFPENLRRGLYKTILHFVLSKKRQGLLIDPYR